MKHEGGALDDATVCETGWLMRWARRVCSNLFGAFVLLRRQFISKALDVLQLGDQPLELDSKRPQSMVRHNGDRPRGHCDTPAPHVDTTADLGERRGRVQHSHA